MIPGKKYLRKRQIMIDGVFREAENWMRFERITQTGAVFRLKNKGIQNLNGRGRGDQYLKVNIEIPKNLTRNQKDILKKFEESVEDTHYAKKKSFGDKIKDFFK